MRSTKSMAVVAVFLLALCGVWFLPSVSGQGQGNSLLRRVEILEAQVADLTERVEDLEQGQVPPGTSFDVLHLNPQPQLPDNPSDVDICVVGEGEDRTISCYVNGEWWPWFHFNPIIR